VFTLKLPQKRKRQKMTDPNPQLPWGIQQVQPGSMKTISQTKLATFAVGLQKKSRFQKAREEAEEKKRKEEEEAAKIYGQFVASFAGEEDTVKTFVR
jgi:U2-associated protein SR140